MFIKCTEIKNKINKFTRLWFGFLFNQKIEILTKNKLFSAINNEGVCKKTKAIEILGKIIRIIFRNFEQICSLWGKLL